MPTRSSFGIPALALAFILSLAASDGAAAQERPVDFDARGGIALAAGNLGDATDGVAPSFNVGFNFGLTDRLLLRVTGGADMHEGIDLGEPVGNEGVNDLEFNLIHFHAGGFYYLLEREDRGAFATLTGTAGLTNLNIPRVATSVGTDAIEFEISELYFSAAGGLSLGYALHEQVDLFLDGHAFVVFADEEDTADVVQVVNDVGDESVDGLGTMWSVPVTAGIRLHF